MSAADGDLVTDLDHLDQHDDEDNAAWARKLFPPSRRTASESSTATAPSVAPPVAPPADEPRPPTTPEPGPPVPAPKGPAMPQPVDLAAMAAALDDPIETPPDTGDSDRPSTPGAIWASVLVVLAVIGTAVMTTILLATGRSDEPAHTDTVPTLAEAPPAPAPQVSNAPAPAEDVIPYHAQWRGCYEGSTDEQTLQQALQDPTSTSTAVCVRGFGGAGGGTNGQQLYLTFGNDMTGNQFYYVSRFEITPGWVPKVPGGKDEWGMHLVPKRIRYVFNPDSARPTVGECDTGAARGAVPCIPPRPVLASALTIVVIEAVRPPGDIPPVDGTATSTPPMPSFGATPTPDPTEVTATDGTFAISLLQPKGQVAAP